MQYYKITILVKTKVNRFKPTDTEVKGKRQGRMHVYMN